MLHQNKKLIFLSTAAFAASVIFALNSYGGFWGDFLTSVINEDNIVLLTNNARKEERKTRLFSSRALSVAAQQKADDMMKEQYFAHENPSGKTAWNYMDEFHYPYLFAGENLAINFLSSEELLKGWLTSKDHHANLVSNRYTEIGIGIANGNFMGTDSVIIVQFFGNPLPIEVKPIEKRAAGTKTAARSKKRIAYRHSLQQGVKGASTERSLEELKENGEFEWRPQAKIQELFLSAAPKEPGIVPIFLVGASLLFLLLNLKKAHLEAKKSI